MDNPLEAEDVSDAFWRPLTDREETALPGLLERAWAMLQQQSEGIEARIDAGSVVLATVEQVLLQAIFRVLNNPAGRRQENRSQDDYTEGWTLDKGTGSLYFADSELRQVGASSQASRGKAFTIDTTPVP